MAIHFHPKNGTKFITRHEKVLAKGTDKPLASDNDLPLCKEVVRGIFIAIDAGDGLVRYIPVDRDFLKEILRFAEEIEAKEPVFTTADWTEKDAMELRAAFNKVANPYQIDPNRLG